MGNRSAQASACAGQVRRLSIMQQDRRTFLTTALGTLAAARIAARAPASQQPFVPAPAPPRDWSRLEPISYPDPDVIALSPAFRRYIVFNTVIRRLHIGTLWAEGPAWNGVGQYLVWSDIPNNVQMRWINEDSRVTTFRNPSGYSNGNTFDYEGRQISFEHGNRRVVRYEHNGKVTVLADKWQGKPLNAPNDGAVYPDGGIWFTDPGYGSLLNYEGFKGELFHKEAVYRIDPKSGKMEKLIDRDDGLFKPNGLCFSNDYRKLYVADTGASHYPDVPKEIKVYDIIDGVKVGKGRQFAPMEMEVLGTKKAGFADGIRCDIDGNLWAAMGWVGNGYDGVHIFAPDGTRIGQIRLPEICGNLCFGGSRRNRLFMAGSQSLYAVFVETQGGHIT
jgi:gluconolactonase